MSANRPKTDRKQRAPRTAFKPGQSGNPSGRPKKTDQLRRIEDLAKQYSEDAILALIDEAKNGKGAPRVSAAIAVLDRGWGTPVKRQESGDPGAFNASDISDDELEAEIKETMELAVKNGNVKVLRPGKVG